MPKHKQDDRLPVLFRADRLDGELWITAVFPTMAGTHDPNTFTIYQHVGQHGSGTRAWYNRTRAATPAEYAPLLKELRGIYEVSHGDGDPAITLDVVRRMTRKHDAARRAQLERIEAGV